MRRDCAAWLPRGGGGSLGTTLQSGNSVFLTVSR